MDLFNNVYGVFAGFVNKLSVFNKNKFFTAPDITDLRKSLDDYRRSLSFLKIEQNNRLDLTEDKIQLLNVNHHPKTLKQLVKALDLLKYEGDVIASLSELGYKLDNNPDLKTIADLFKIEHEKYEGFHLLARAQSRIDVTNEMYKRLGNIDFNDENVFNDVLKKNLWLKKYFDSFLELLKTRYSVDGDKPPMVGDWLRVSIPNINDVSLSSIFKAIQKHQKLIKGCWAVKYTGEKCLIDNLSCGYMKKQHENHMCVDKFKCPGKKCGCKNSKFCSKFCSNLYIPVSADTVLMGIKGTFWLAAQDYMMIIIEIPSGIPFSPNPPPIQPKDPSADEPDTKDEPEVIDIPVSSGCSFFSSKLFWVLIIILIIFLLILIYSYLNR